MAISAQCHQCGFKYNAPDSLAGKKVRCKRCSAVFAVPTASGGEDWGGNLDVMEETANSMSGAAMNSGSRSGSGRAVPQPAASSPDDIDSVLRGGDGEEMSQADVLRSTTPFDYPYSKHVDSYLPLALTVLAGLLIAKSTFAQDDLGRPWVPFLRLALVIGLYAAIVFPLTHFGVKKGVAKQNGHMPWSPRWKSFGIFAIPYALGYMLWLTGGSIASLLLGCLVGLVVGLSALWLLYRIRFERGPEPLVYGGATFIVSVIIAGAFLVGVNLTTLAIAKGSQSAHLFAASPIMPYLAWDSTPPPAEEEEVPSLPPVATTPPPDADSTATPTETPTETAATTTDPATPTDQTDSAVATTEQPTPPEEAAPKPDEVATATPVEPVAPPIDAVAPPAEGEGQVDHGTTVAETPVGEERSPIVAQIAAAPIEPGFDRLLYPLDGPTAVLVVRKDGQDDVLEGWSTATEPWTMVGRTTVRPEPNHNGEQYAISPDGTLVARISSWPTLSVQVMSLKDAQPQVLPLKDGVGEPSLLGFTDATHLLVSYRNGGAYGLEYWDIRAQRAAQHDLRGVETLNNNFALSPDGRTFAVAARGTSGPVVQTFQLSTGRAIRPMPIRLLDLRWGVQPSGIAYSPDGTMLAALFEKDGNALLNIWKLPLGGNIAPFIYPSGALPAKDQNQRASGLAWIGNGQAWLVHGSEIIDSARGRVIGRTGLKQVANQQVAGPDVVHVAHTNSDGLKQLSILRLDLDKLSELTRPDAGN